MTATVHKKGTFQRVILCLSVVLLFMTLLACSAVGLEIDNVGSYDEDTKTYTVKNSLLGIPTTKVAKITLETPLVNPVMPGENRKVAQFTITNYEANYTNALKLMEFLDIDKGMIADNRVFTYKKGVETLKTRDVYEETCKLEAATQLNLTLTTKCSMSLKGTENYYEMTWQTISSADPLPAGNTTIGVFTTVKRNDNIEWIPTMFGQRIDEWAVWVDGLNNGLYAYYKFTENQGTVTREETGQRNNATFNGTLNSTAWVTGIDKSGLLFDTPGNLIQAGRPFPPTGALSLSLWFNSNNTPSFSYPVKGNLSVAFSAGNVWTQWTPDGNTPRVQCNATGADTDGEWHNLVFTRNSNGSYLTYIDNVTLVCATQNLGTVGNLTFGSNGYTGILDEVGIWNRTLNRTAVGALYSNGEGMFFNRTPSVIDSVSAAYPGELYSLRSELFNITVNYNGDNVQGLRSSFTHNNTNWTVTQVNVSVGQVLFSVSPSMPSVTSNTNKTFFWDIVPSLFNGSDSATQRYSYSHRVLTNNFTDCVVPAPGQVIAVNFSAFDERNSTSLTFDMNGNFILWENNAAANQTLSVSLTAQQNVYLCVNNMSNATVTVQGDLEYDAVGYNQRNWFLRGLEVNLSLSQQRVNLYLLDDQTSDSTRFVVTDDVENPLDGRKVHAQRKDLSTGSFFTVAMASTDSEGAAYFPVEWFDATYKFLVFDQSNSLEFTTSETVLQTTPNFIRVDADSIIDKFENFDNMQTSLSFNNATKVFSLTYADGSGAIREVCLDVRRVSTYVSNVTVCSVCQTASSGTIDCLVGDNTGIYTAIAYAKQNPEASLLILTWENIQDFGQNLGLDGIAYSLLLTLTIILMFVFSATTAVIAVIISAIVIGLLGIASIPYVAVSSIVVLGIIALSVMKS